MKIRHFSFWSHSKSNIHCSTIFRLACCLKTKQVMTHQKSWYSAKTSIMCPHLSCRQPYGEDSVLAFFGLVGQTSSNLSSYNWEFFSIPLHRNKYNFTRSRSCWTRYTGVVSFINELYAHLKLKLSISILFDVGWFFFRITINHISKSVWFDFFWFTAYQTFPYYLMLLTW